MVSNFGQCGDSQIQTAIIEYLKVISGVICQLEVVH